MRLSVATNYDPALVEALREYPVTELYGKLRQDAVGGGRAPYQLAPVSREQVAAHVAHARRVGIGFNYLLNAACLGNREITRRGQREIERLLDWVSEIGATAVTIATPLLLQLVKERYPHLRVRISLFAGVDRPAKARMWEDLGADCIVLDGMLVNREFKTLRRIRQSVGCDLELLANNSCLMACALAPMHMNAIAHSAQSWHANKGFLVDWCFLKCTEMKVRDPLNYVRSEWIRPEDLHAYEELGYDLFKIVERDLPTPTLVKRVRAYAERRFEGNLLELVQPFGFQGVRDDRRYYRRGLRWLLRFIVRPGLVNPARMLLLKRLAEVRGMTRPLDGDPPVVIDNRKLDGFIERFRTKGCREEDCEQCRWCHQFVERAVRVDPKQRSVALGAYEDLFGAMRDGSMWRYLPARRKSKHGACGQCMKS